MHRVNVEEISFHDNLCVIWKGRTTCLIWLTFVENAVHALDFVGQVLQNKPTTTVYCQKPRFVSCGFMFTVRSPNFREPASLCSRLHVQSLFYFEVARKIAENSVRIYRQDAVEAGILQLSLRLNEKHFLKLLVLFFCFGLLKYWDEVKFINKCDFILWISSDKFFFVLLDCFAICALTILKDILQPKF